MKYHSTRSRSEAMSSKDALIQGLASDGGLYVTDALDELSLNIGDCMTLSYEEIAEKVFSLYLPDFSSKELRDCIGKAYAKKFDDDRLTPVTTIGGDRLLELFHGPTSAFKDMALCMLPQLMSAALKERQERIMILTATSGDTGKAALEGFKNAENIGISVFYPHGGVSDIQYLQMATQEGRNTAAAAVTGNFDDCQSAVKEVFEKHSAEILERTGVRLSSANSINIGRLIPQVVYYIDAYRQLLNERAITMGDPVDFIVPTGNFGDVLAGFFAKKAGLPIGKLLVASNENKVLTDFLESGVYDRRRPFIKTISPSMDILISSNLERLLYYACGGDTEYICSLMKSLRETGSYRIDDAMLKTIRENFCCGYADNETSGRAIKEAWEKDGRLIDPHTAVAYSVLKDRRAELEGKAQIILSTASPYKFPKEVYEAVFGGADRFDSGFACMDALEEKTGIPAPAALKELRSKPVLHRAVIPADGIKDFTFQEIERQFK